ncbi:MAG: glutamate racemase [Acholeplasmataceae bacterium]
MTRPIGIFDSGLGGLSILGTMLEKIDHDFIYVADQAFAPYGTKEEHRIKDRVRAITDYFHERGVRTVVIACNTASVVSQNMSFSLPVISMIDNVVEEVLETTGNKRVIVLSTDFTARSHVYRDALARYGIDVTEVSSSPLVGLVESGKAGSEASFSRTREHLEDHVDESADTIVLGCTHFGWLKREIGSIYRNARLVLGDRMIAKRLKGISADRDGSSRIEMLTTGPIEAIERAPSIIGSGLFTRIDRIRI